MRINDYVAQLHDAVNNCTEGITSADETLAIIENLNIEVESENPSYTLTKPTIQDLLDIESTAGISYIN